jgi:hypothetical protein
MCEVACVMIVEKYINKMAKKKKSSRTRTPETKESALERLSKDTLNAVLGVLAMVLTLALLFAAFGKGGQVGQVVYEFLSYLFGIGYYLVALVFFMLSISLFQSREKSYAWPQTIGAILFFVSSLGLTSLLFPLRGGVVGGLLSGPLLSLFDMDLSVVILSSLIIISFLVIFDSSIKIDLFALLKRIFGKKEKTPEELEEMEAVKIENAVEKVRKIEDAPKETYKENVPLPKKISKDEEGFVPMVTRRLGRSRRHQGECKPDQANPSELRHRSRDG